MAKAQRHSACRHDHRWWAGMSKKRPAALFRRGRGDERQVPAGEALVAAVAEEGGAVAGSTPFHLLDAAEREPGAQQRALDAIAQVEMGFLAQRRVVGRLWPEERAAG